MGRECRWPVLVALAIATTACGVGPITLEGIVTASRQTDAPAEGVDVTLHDAGFEPFDETVTRAGGAFSLTAPRASEVHLVIEGEGLVPIAFAGESGVEDEFTVPNGQLWAFTESEEARWRADFAGCPGAEDAPGMIIGETRLYLLPLDEPVQGPIEQAGFAYVEDRDAPEGTRVDACYLDDEGTAWDPEALATGRTGRFAIFGIEGGPWVLTVGRYSAGGTLLGRSTVFVPEGGVVSRHPALVSL